VVEVNYPLFYVLRSTNNTRLTDCDIIDVDDDLTAQVGPLDSVRCQKDGALILKASSSSQSRLLPSILTVAGTSVTSIPHDTLNSSKGTIYHEKLLGISTERLLFGLQKKGFPVTDVYRFVSGKVLP
jgi:hypothetical protein